MLLCETSMNNISQQLVCPDAPRAHPVPPPFSAELWTARHCWKAASPYAFEPLCSKKEQHMSWTFVKPFLEIWTCGVHWIPFLSLMVVLSSKKPNQMVKSAFSFLEAISLCSRCVFLSVFPVLISEKDFVRHFLQVKFNEILRSCSNSFINPWLRDNCLNLLSFN